jgi:hypothetical protein
VHVYFTHTSRLLIYDLRIITMELDPGSFILGFLCGALLLQLVRLITSMIYGNARAVRPAEVASVTRPDIDNT